MDWADDVTYAVHDMDDFYRAGLIPLDSLCRGDDEFDAFKRYLEKKTPAAVEIADQIFAGLGITLRYEGRVSERAQLRQLGSRLITRFINAFTVVDEGDEVCVVVDDEIAQQVAVLKQLIWFYIIERPSLAITQAGQRKIVRDLVDLYMGAVGDSSQRKLLGPLYAERLEVAETDGARSRVVIDLIASLTEDSATEIYRRASGVVSGSLLAAPRT